jgi:predicted transcriptional regulator
MMTTSRPLLDRTAEDLMSPHVVTLPHGMSLRAAAHLLAQSGVSGAPVTDESGRCIGVLSRSDLVRFLDQGAAGTDRVACAGGCSTDWQVFDLDILPAKDVTAYMTADVVTVARSTRIGEVARIMCQEHIHRVLVADRLGRVVGIVSTLDVLAALAEEADGV